MSVMDAKPGESCSNDHWDNKFTCPNCYADHEFPGAHGPQYITCHCGARLRCQLEVFESCVCTVAYPDEEDGDA